MQARFGMGVVILAAVLSGCGGGSSGDQVQVGGGNPQPVPPLPGAHTQAVFDGGTNNDVIDPLLDPATGQPTAASPDLQGPQFAFSATSPDLEGPAFALPAGLASPRGTLFEEASYAGAFSQDTQDNWTAGWTVSLNGNTTVWEPAVAPAADGNCPAGTTDIGDQALPAAVGGGTMDVCQLASRYATDGSTITLTPDNVYRLASGFPGTYIGNGECEIGAAGCQPADVVSVTLVIQPGTLLLGNPQEALIVTRGSKIDARGTATDPIVMSSVAQFNGWVAGGEGDSGRGEWAGVAIMGYADTTDCGGAVPCNINAEGNIGFYGGNDDDDDSGTLKYVVILYAGNDIDGNGNELNGLTMFATGSGTRSSYVQVHKGLDDGIEHFGATDFMDHVVLTDNGDDSFDWGQGYRGGAQFVVIKQATDAGDKGIEADNDPNGNDNEPRSAPVLANFTIIGRSNGLAAGGGVLLRRGTAGSLHNFVVVDFRDACLDVDDAATAAQFNGGLTIDNSLLWCPLGEEFKTDTSVTAAQVQAWYESGTNNQIVNPNLSPIGIPNPAGAADTNFVSTNYVGAFAQDVADTWTEGWTVGLHGNASVWAPVPAAPTADGACPAGTTDIGDQDLSAHGGGAMDICQLSARYATDGQVLTLTNGNIYRLASGFPGTYIGNGECEVGSVGCRPGDIAAVTLRIQPGTLILGNPQEALIVTRGSRIEAQGTAESPIVMTSQSQFEAGTTGRGEWAGLALMGFGATNECGPSPCNVNAEGNIGFYGGDRDDDDSGFLAYVVIMQAGNDIDGNGNELNGLTMFGTGSATRASYVQVHYGLDDGIEHFGATDFMDHIVLTGNADDSFDWGQGYRGGAQFVLVVQADDDGDAGIEADNDANDPNAEPVSAPTLANFTIIGSGGGTAASDTRGMLLRRGTGALIYNTVVTGSDICLKIDGSATFARASDGRLAFENSIVACAVDFQD